MSEQSCRLVLAGQYVSCKIAILKHVNTFALLPSGTPTKPHPGTPLLKSEPESQKQNHDLS